MYNVEILFRDTGVLFTLKRDILSMMIDYNFIKTDSIDSN